MKKLFLLMILVVFLSGCEHGQYYDTGPILVDKQLIRFPNTYPEDFEE